MSIDTQQLRVHVIQITLRTLQEKTGLPLAGPSAEALLLATAAQESAMGRWIDQKESAADAPGPAYGIYQMEAPTYADTMARCPEKLRKVIWKMGMRECPFRVQEAQEMVGNMWLATAVARAKYWLVPKALPAANDIDGQWAYYKLWWNSMLGAATEEQFKTNYRKYIGGGR